MNHKATRALSLLFHAGKTIENRQNWRYGCKLRGPIWIHASSGIVLKDFDAAVDTIVDASDRSKGPDRESFLPKGQIDLHHYFTGTPRPDHVVQKYRPGPDLARGAIVGKVDILGVVSAGTGVVTTDEENRALTQQELAWWFRGFALLIGNPVPLRTPVPCHGRLGFWRVGEDVLRACEEQLVPWPEVP